MGKYYQHRGGRIHYTDQGSGKPILLIHGYLETLDVWDDFASKLSGKHRIITVDLPGHGGSDLIAEIQTMESIAETLKGLLENLGIEKVFLAGHSLGGYITLAFADIYPDLLSGYCLFHSHPFADPPETLEKREREIVLVKAGKKDLMYPENIAKMFANKNLDKFQAELQRSKEIASSICGEAIIAVLRGMMARQSRLAVMEAGKVPCLWILGALDNYINCELVQAKVKLPVNAELSILWNSGHMGFIEEEIESLKIIDSFINRNK